jgi:hypothetical protein
LSSLHSIYLAGYASELWEPAISAELIDAMEAAYPKAWLGLALPLDV